jgi:hypothetical protein
MAAHGKHGLGQKALRVKAEQQHRRAIRAFDKAISDAKSGKCFSAARWDVLGSQHLGAAEAYTRAGRLPLEGGASQEKMFTLAFDAKGAFASHCKATGPLSGMKRGPQRRSRRDPSRK